MPSKPSDFPDAAEQDGGTEVLTAEWMELQLDSLCGQLAVLQHTPDQALYKFMAEHLALDCAANRQLIAEHIQKNYGTVEQAVSALADRLSFNQEVADEESRQHQQQRLNYLANEASSQELRQVARQEAEQRRKDFIVQEDQRQVAAREQKEAGQFDPIPEFNSVTGERLDAAYFIALSNKNIGAFRQAVRRWGSANLTARLRGIR